MGKLFGTDGVRGVANTELTPEIAFNLGRAGATVLTKERKQAARIIIGMDTRISGGMLEQALAAGICSVGAYAVLAGVVPTPGIAYLIRHYEMDAGVVISASHNPCQDNGIKFFNREGYKLPDEMEEEIEALFFHGLEHLPRPTGGGVGVKEVIETTVADYAAYLASSMEPLDLKGLKIAVDCANGATFETAPRVFKQLNGQVKFLHCNPDGKNINENCGSTHMESLSAYVKEHHMDIGIAYDGDGDRCLLTDEEGVLVDGDQMMSICAAHMLENNTLNKNTVVATVMSNLGFFIMGDQMGIKIEKTHVGDRYVIEKMREMGASLGGEQSGHIIFMDYNSTGDGILTSLQILKIMKQTGKKLSELNSLMKVMPQVLINAAVSQSKKYHYEDDELIRNEIIALENKFAGKGRVLIRPSGTEALVRVMIEGENIDEITKEAKRVAELLEQRLS